MYTHIHIYISIYKHRQTHRYTCIYTYTRFLIIYLHTYSYIPVYTGLAEDPKLIHCFVNIPKFSQVILERVAVTHVLVIVLEKDIVEVFEFGVCVFLNDSDSELPIV